MSGLAMRLHGRISAGPGRLLARWRVMPKREPIPCAGRASGVTQQSRIGERLHIATCVGRRNGQCWSPRMLSARPWNGRAVRCASSHADDLSLGSLSAAGDSLAERGARALEVGRTWLAVHENIGML